MSASASTPRYRRSPWIVVSWGSAGPICFNCQTATRHAVTIEALAFLERLNGWTSPDELARAFPDLGSSADVAGLFETLAERGLVDREDAESRATEWRNWSPEAAFFHFGTRDRRYPTESSLMYDAHLREKAKAQPPPAPTTRVNGERVALPPSRLNGNLETALRMRRTWRRFSSEPLSLQNLATLLRMTWGVQGWGLVPGQGRVALKTAPSGGARHSLEAYVIALNVADLKKGVYHYDAATHEVVDVQRSVDLSALEDALAHQRYFMPAGALVVMSAVFARAMWRYPQSRAYRLILTEAGHLGQTFCLIATALDLAPFCTMAFRETAIERILGIDGVNESAMYVVGVGTRPRGRVARPGKIPKKFGG